MMLLESLARAATGPDGREFRAQLSNHFDILSPLVDGLIVSKGKVRGQPEHVTKFNIEKWNSVFTSASELQYLRIQGGSTKVCAAMQYQ